MAESLFGRGVARRGVLGSPGMTLDTHQLVFVCSIEVVQDSLWKQQMRHLPQHLPQNPKHKSTTRNANCKLSVRSMLKAMPHAAIERHVRHLLPVFPQS